MLGKFPANLITLDEESVTNFDWFMRAIDRAASLERLVFLAGGLKADAAEGADYTTPENLAALRAAWAKRYKELGGDLSNIIPMVSRYEPEEA
jgi:hypothetical protein